jgi:ABC-2 type transport system permease protein
MKNLAAALYVEVLKTRKSKMLPATFLVFTIIPLMMGLMMFVARNPELAAKLGMIGTKAKLFGENDWTI